jgi:hypothetical protein
VYFTRNFSARRPTSFCNWKEPTPILLIATYQSPSKNGEREMNDPEAVTEPFFHTKKVATRLLIRRDPQRQMSSQAQSLLIAPQLVYQEV